MFNFPNSPTEGQTFTPVGGYQYVFTDGKWRVVENPQTRATAEARNRIVNGAMQISQENARTAGTTNSYFPADQWRMDFSTTGAPITATSLYHTLDPEAGNNYWARLNNTTADTSIAATEYYTLRTFIEGIKIVDFQWGTASALPAVLRFRAFSSFSATFCVALRSGASDRTFCKNCTITANTPTTFTIPIPATTTGTFATDTSLALSIIFTVMAGTNFNTGVDGQWVNAGPVATPQCSNWMSATAQTLDITDVGLYLDPDATGLAPKWTMPDEAEELRACQRYWNYFSFGGLYMGLVTAVSNIMANVNYYPRMRIVPAVTGIPNSVYNNVGSTITPSGGVTPVMRGSETIQIQTNHSSAITGIPPFANGVLNARM